MIGTDPVGVDFHIFYSLNIIVYEININHRGGYKILFNLMSKNI